PEAFKASMGAFLQSYPVFQWDPTSNFQGVTYDYDTDENLWGDVGFGPNGANWDLGGLNTTNVFMPGYFSGQKPVLGHPPIMSADFFQRTYLRGLEKFIAEYGDIESQFQYFLDTAVAAIEAKLGLFIYPRVLITDAIERGFRPGIDFDIEIKEKDFIAEDFFNWGWMTLQYGPIMNILQLQMVYPTGAEILKFPNSWVKPLPLSRQIRLVPPQGALSQVVIGPGGFMVMLIGGMVMDMPALIFADYVAGMWPIPQQLVHAIGMQTAIYFLEVFSDMLAQGMREYVAESAGIRVMKRFAEPDSRQGSTLAFHPRIKQYEKQINQIIFDFQQAYFAQNEIYVV
ncbi:MAG: hypothetical protein K6T83_15440, partial [Alicyclobacillus sp.]|nr:hypothetical protein [Alicyclobacillus sp.]